MPTIFAASETSVQVNGTSVEGVKAVEYRSQQTRTNVYALGSVERIGMVSGPAFAEGRIRFVSTDPTLNALTTETKFDLLVIFKRGTLSMEVAFDECFLTEKQFEMTVGGTGEAVYSFTAARIRQDPPKTQAAS
jgi:hypothetical protein